jgi:hypothetical protein
MKFITSVCMEKRTVSALREKVTRNLCASLSTEDLVVGNASR